SPTRRSSDLKEPRPGSPCPSATPHENEDRPSGSRGSGVLANAAPGRQASVFGGQWTCRQLLVEGLVVGPALAGGESTHKALLVAGVGLQLRGPYGITPELKHPCLAKNKICLPK